MSFVNSSPLAFCCCSRRLICNSDAEALAFPRLPKCAGTSGPAEAATITPVASGAPDADCSYARRLDVGVPARLGYRCGAVLAQAGYSLGLRNIAPTASARVVPVSQTPYYNGAFQVSLAYLFSPKA